MIGSSVQLFGVECGGCCHFSGIFSVLAVQDDEPTALVVDPEVIEREGAVAAKSFGPMRIDWDPVLQCWEAQCSGHHLVVKLGGHFRGPRLEERPAARAC